MAAETSTGYVPVPLVDPQNDDASAPPPPKQARPSHEQPDQYHPVVTAPPSRPSQVPQLQHQSNAKVITSQPVPSTATLPPVPWSYIGFSVLVTWCCCFIIGSFAVDYSRKVNNEFLAGRIEKAKSAARIALWLNITGALTGTAIWITTSIVVIVILTSD